MITESASSTNSPPTIASSTSCFVITATAAMAAPSDSAPTSPMMISAGWQLNQRNPRDAPDERPAEDRELSRLRDEGDLQVARRDRVARDVGQDRVGAGGDAHGPDGQAVQAVRQVHGVRGADHDHRHERNIEDTEVDEQPLEEGERHDRREASRGPPTARWPSATAKATRNCGTSLPRPVSPRLAPAGDLDAVVGEPHGADARARLPRPIQTNRFGRSIQSSVADDRRRRG